MEISETTINLVVAGADIAVAVATLVLAYQARAQLRFMQDESKLAKYPNVLLFPEGIFVRDKPPVEHHGVDEALGFVFFNANPKPVVYLGGHLFKWDEDRRLSDDTFRNLGFGDHDRGWLGYLYPRTSASSSRSGSEPRQARTVIIDPSGTLTLAVDTSLGLLDFFSEKSGEKPFFVLVVLSLAYPTTPGGAVMVGVPFRLKSYVGSELDYSIGGEMIANWVIYSGLIAKKIDIGGS